MTKAAIAGVVLLSILWLPVLGAPTGIRCPAGTVPTGEQTPEVHEAWCEKVVDGKTLMHGPYRAWWPNGRLGTSGQYANGQATGEWKDWYQNGKVQGREWYVAGKLSRSEYFSESGERISAPSNPSNAAVAKVPSR
jgi:hypothetical protein